MSINFKRIRERLSFTLMALLALAAADAPAQSLVSWSVHDSYSVADFDDDLGDESEHVYIVTNASQPGDANNLVTFTVLAGADRGVFDAGCPQGWLAHILADRTVFQGNGNYIATNSSGNFYLYSRYTGTAPGAAEAASAYNGPFPVLAVTVPAHAPPALALARVATNAFAVAVSSPDAPSFLLQYRDTLAPTNWTDLRLCAVTGAVTVVTDTNAAPTRFYRALVPVP